MPHPIADYWTRHWRVRNGRVLEIARMDDRHLCNTIRFLLRRAAAALARVEASAYAYLASDPPDGAALCTEQGLAGWEAADPWEVALGWPQFRGLVAEAARRGLEG